MPNIFELLGWNLIHVTLLVPRILRCLVYFWKICATSIYWVLFVSTCGQTKPMELFHFFAIISVHDGHRDFTFFAFISSVIIEMYIYVRFRWMTKGSGGENLSLLHGSCKTCCIGQILSMRTRMQYVYSKRKTTVYYTVL
jgi:hypothetical protein